MLDRLFANTGYVLFVAAAWTALFHLNGFFFNAAEISPFVSLIFLPAVLRPVAVLLFGLPGAIGLILGDALTTPMTLAPNYVTALMIVSNGIVAWGVFTLMRQSSAYRTQLTADMAGLTLRTIVVFAALTALASSTTNTFLISLSQDLSSSSGLLLSMVAGDAIGAMLMLYLLSIFSPMVSKHVK